MLLDQCRYIVVEGPIGAGKTTLARRLADHLRASLLLEAPERNAFLPKFYKDASRYALPTQLSFLLQRAEQTAQLAQLDLFSGQTVADYMFEKDALFAELTLNDEEFKLYKSIYAFFSQKAPRPDLVIYLQAPAIELRSRVQQRGNYYELDITENYLQRLSDSYSRFFHQYAASPLLIVNGANFNFVDGADDFELFLQCIKQMRGPREYLNRA